MAVFSYLFPVIFACVSYLLYHKFTYIHPSIIQKPDKRYDYIIVGAGTAGCVIAARLSEDPKNKVLLIEAGDHMGYFTKIPLMPTAAQLGPNDWSVRTKPQKYSSFGLWDQSQLLPRGKGLGGSGQINFLLHGFGLPEDYERWTKLGFDNWSLEDLKPYFIKAFGTVRSEFDSSYCAGDGQCRESKAPMKLKQIDKHNELLNVFQEASAKTKNKYVLFKKATATINGGVRVSSYDAYLKPILHRHNLHVVLNTEAISVRFENKTALSVYILQNHRELNNIFVNKEIILCAGAVKSPQLLIRSGIGPKLLLKRMKVKMIAENNYVGRNLHDHMIKMKVKMIAENNYVGRNLHDHMNMPIFVSIEQPISTTLSKVFSFNTLWNYFWKNNGYLAFPPVIGVEYRNNSAVMLFSMGTASERLLSDLSNYKSKVFRDTFPFYNQSSKEGFIFLATCIQPRSRGTVTLRVVSTHIPPVVDPSYLHDTEDVKCILKAIRRAEHLLSTQPFRDIGAKVHWPRPERCLSFWNYTREDQIGSRRRKRIPRSQNIQEQMSKKKPQSTIPRRPPDDYLECIIREVAVTGHHAGGTCAAPHVVDNQLRVKSVHGLRIMDASVLPSPISLYPNSVIVAMAEKLSDNIIYNNNDLVK